MTAGEFLNLATKHLNDAGIPSARLDCLILLEDHLGHNRAALIAHPETKISKETEIELNTKIAQRANHLPLAYIRKTAPFYGREFIVTPHVLVPRPETENIITLLKQIIDLPSRPRIADIGTGSGCLGITAALEIKNATVVLCDIDQAALQVAKQNLKKHHATASCEQSDLLMNVAEHFDALLVNLPYVPDDLPVERTIGYEPAIALFGGHDGLDVYRRFWQQVGDRSDKPQIILTESLAKQHTDMQKLALAADYTLVASDGLIQHFTIS